jgi:tryptophan 7-halogenase
VDEAGNSINRILIVGGGTAGWMAAAYLRRRTHCPVTLVESPDVGTIGVGEATIPALVDWIRGMQIDEDTFLRRCHGTSKLGIRFLNWIRPGHCYWHPFGLCGGHIDGIDLIHFWLKRRRAGRTDRDYTHYSLQTLLAEQGKAHRLLGGPALAENYAYHLDAGDFAAFLRELATGEGVEHLLDNVRNVVVNERGHIERVETERHALTADLYLDCTGFRALLIERALGDPFVDWSHYLLCDRAVVLRLPVSHMEPCGRSRRCRRRSRRCRCRRRCGRQRPGRPRRSGRRSGRRPRRRRRSCPSPAGPG